MVKSGGPETTRVAVAVRVIAPLVAVIVNGYVPGAIVVVGLMDSCALPEPCATNGGLKDQVACCADSPVSPRVTSPPKPFVLAMDAVYTALPPGATVTDEGDAETVKSGLPASR